MTNKRLSALMLTAIAAVSTLTGLSAAAATPASVELLNVSYDPTRELYEAVNKAFAAQWLAQTGQQVTIHQSHGGSGTAKDADDHR